MRRWRLAGMLLLGVAAAGPARGDEWPSRPIHAVVPLTGGSATDIVARTVLEQVASRLGQPIVVENRPGAGNTIGMASVARASPDGYTFLINSSSHTTVPATYATLPFDTLRDLAPVIPFGNMPIVVVTSPAKGYHNLADLVAAARMKPGALNFSTAGVGNFSHFATEVFRRAARFDAVHVPSRGAPEAITEVLAGRTDFFFSPLVLALPLVRDGKLQALAVSGSQRAGALPDVPTTVEAGYPGSEYNFWVAAFAPAQTPSDIIARLSAETAAALRSDAVRQKLAALGVDPMAMSPAAFGKLVRDEVQTNSRVAAEAGIKAN